MVPTAGRNKPSARAACLAQPVHYDSAELEPEPLDPASAAELERCAVAASPAECRFGIARQYFTAKRYELAAPIFGELGTDRSAKDVAIYAAQLELECLNVLGSRTAPARLECFELMAQEVPELQAVHCTGTAGASTAELCQLLEQIDAGIARLKAERLIKEADHGGPNAPSLYGRGADAYWAMYDAFCRPTAGGKAQRARAKYGRCDEILYNAHTAYRAAGQLDQAERARQELLDPKNGLSKSPLAKRLEHP